MSNPSSSSSRRQILAGTAALAAAPALGCRTTRAAAAPPPDKQPICVFTKPLQSLDYDTLADRVAEMGFDGIEATIRSHGHIEPEAAADELPRMVEALRRRNIEITVMATSIRFADDPHAESVLRTAARLGIRRYRMQYLKYDLTRPVPDQLHAYAPRMRELAALNRQLGITAVYQNHVGADNVGASLWDLHILLDGIAADDIAIAYDIRHATVEGGTTWPVTLNLSRPRLGIAYVKDFAWEGRKIRNVPLGQGHIDPKFFSALKAARFAGPISLHEEYIDHRDPNNVPQHLAAMRRDLETLRGMLEAS